MDEGLVRDFRRSDMRPLMKIQLLLQVIWMFQWIMIAAISPFPAFGEVFASRVSVLVLCVVIAVIMPAFSYQAGILMLVRERQVEAGLGTKRVAFKSMAASQVLCDWYRVAAAQCLCFALSGYWNIPVPVILALWIVFLFTVEYHASIAFFADKFAESADSWLVPMKTFVDLRMAPNE